MDGRAGDADDRPRRFRRVRCLSTEGHAGAARRNARHPERQLFLSRRPSSDEEEGAASAGGSAQVSVCDVEHAAHQSLADRRHRRWPVDRARHRRRAALDRRVLVPCRAGPRGRHRRVRDRPYEPDRRRPEVPAVGRARPALARQAPVRSDGGWPTSASARSRRPHVPSSALSASASAPPPKPDQPFSRWPPTRCSFRISGRKATPWPGRSGGDMVPSFAGRTGSIQRSSFQSMYSR